MSEIEKLMRNAGIEKEWKPLPYGDIEEYYPVFTAEKQLELIKLLTQQCDLSISHFGKWEFIHFDGQEPVQETGENFERVLAKVINSRWDDFFTDTEKVEIRRILE